MSRRPTLYEQVVQVSSAFLGPAAERFIARQVQNHLGKKPEDLEEVDLEKLVDWIRIAVALLTEDGKIVDEFTHNLMALAKKHHKAGR